MTNYPTGPQISDPLGNGYADIQTLAAAVKDRIEVEHVHAGTITDREGTHKPGSAIAFFQDSAPTQRLDNTTLGEADRGLLWLKPMPSLATIAYVELYVWDNVSTGSIPKWTRLSTFADSALKTDTISERTTATGVTIDGTLIKDQAITAVKTVTASEKLAVGTDVYLDTVRVKARALKLGIKPASPEDGDIWME